MTDDQRARAGLFPCAHCGGEPMQQRKEQEGYGPGFAILCTGCACATPWVDAMADAFILWNRRASDKREGEAAVELAELKKNMAGAFAADDERLREAAERSGVTYFGCDTPDHMAETIIHLRKMLNHKPAGEVGGWVRCSERMPSDAGNVLVYLPATLAWRGPHMGMAFYSKDEDNFASLDNYIGASVVTHWMPLPTPPEPKTGEGEK